MAALKFAKKNGCNAFDYSRVKLAAFLEWYFQQSDTNQNWDDKYKEFRAKREQQKYTREDGKTVSTDDAVSANAISMGVMNRILRQSFCNDLPAVTKGLDEAGIRKENEAAIERALEEARLAFDDEIAKAKKADEESSMATK